MNRQEKARWLSEIYAAVVEGKTLQIFDQDKVWRDTENFPYISSPTHLWRIKPKPLEFEGTVCEWTKCTLLTANYVRVSMGFKPGTRVRVVEVLEDE